MKRRDLLSIAAASLTGSCGYHVAGKANLMPADIKVIGIPPFTNATTRYKLTAWFWALADNHRLVARAALAVAEAI